MLAKPVRFTRLRWLVSAVTLLALAGGLTLIVVGALRWPDSSGVWLIVAGGAAALLFPVAFSVVMLLLKVESHTARQYNELRDIQETLTQQGRQLEDIADNVRISDAAKHITRRDEERNALRSAIYDEIRGEHWEAALHLTDLMKSRFGYGEEAERLAEEVAAVRTDVMRRKMVQATERIHELFTARSWDQAEREIERLRVALLDERRVTRLADELEEKRKGRKETLLNLWNEALRRSDLDEGINILKELDTHLTREEARQLEQAARSLFKEKLMQLGVQFKFAVTEKRWLDALEIGVQITEEFPNSRMAKEVQENATLLRKRAGLPMDAEVTAAGISTTVERESEPSSQTPTDS